MHVARALTTNLRTPAFLPAITQKCHLLLSMVQQPVRAAILNVGMDVLGLVNLIVLNVMVTSMEASVCKLARMYHCCMQMKKTRHASLVMLTVVTTVLDLELMNVRVLTSHGPPGTRSVHDACRQALHIDSK